MHTVYPAAHSFILHMSLRPVLVSPKRLKTASGLVLSFTTQKNIALNLRNASRLSRRAAAARVISSEPVELPANTPNTLSSWEKPPAIPPKKGYWKTAVLFGYIGGPAVSHNQLDVYHPFLPFSQYALYSWSTWKPSVSS